MSVFEHRFATAAGLEVLLAARIAERLSTAVQARGHASLVVSGGRTPRPLLAQLAQQKLPWAQVQVTLADERWVDPDAADSNERMVRETLLQGAAAQARFVGLKNPATDPDQGQAVCAAALREMPRPFDVVVLGMGEDGHTASLFPGAAGRALEPDCPDLCLPVHPSGAPHPRMSLTAAALLNSRRIMLHISGATKWKIYRHATEPGPIDALPVRVVLNQKQVPVEVYWHP